MNEQLLKLFYSLHVIDSKIFHILYYYLTKKEKHTDVSGL